METEQMSEQEALDHGLIPAGPGDEQQEIDQSFIESDAHYWNGIKLEPFGSRRQAAANCLGLRFGNLSKDEIDRTLESNSYPDMMQDAIMIIYLCYPRGKAKETGMTDSIEESYAACDPSARKMVRRRMLEWAESEGIEIGSVQLSEAFSVMVKIVKESMVNQFKLPKAEGKAPKGN
jgi:hypothetical protein